MWSGAGHIKCREAPDEITTGQLAELHAEQWARGLIALARQEIALHDLAGRACAEGVALTRQIRAGHCLSDGCKFRWNDVHAFKAAGHSRAAVGRRSNCHEVVVRISARHPKHGQHIADTINHSNGCLVVSCARLSHRLRNDLLYIGRSEPSWRVRTRACAAAVGGTSAATLLCGTLATGCAATTAACAEQQGRDEYH